MSHDPEKPAAKTPPSAKALPKEGGTSKAPGEAGEPPGEGRPAKPAARPEGLAPPTAKAQTLINLKAWMPFLQNPGERARLIRYAAREARDTGTWRIGLPVKCWKCQTTEGLKPRKISRSLRSFENAIPIAVAGTTFAVIQFILSLLMLIWGNFGWSGTFAFTGVLTALLAAGVLWLKSWEEDVKYTLHSCSSCEFEMRAADMATDQEELHLFLPTPELTQAAMEEQKAERRKGKSGGEAPPAEETADKPKKKKAKAEGGEAPVAGQKPSLAKPKPMAPPDLPPISLDDAPASPRPIQAKVVQKPTPAPRPPEDLPPIKLDD